jgi:hypothetical protein
MRRAAFMAWLLSIVAASYPAGASSRQAPPNSAGATDPNAVIARYCASCHSERMHSGDLVLSGVDANDAASNSAVLERVVRRLRTNAMPPAGAPRPDAETLARLTHAIESTLDREAAAHPHPGTIPSAHRLNRAEYANAIRDLLAVPIDAAVLLPPDDSGFGFDNIADVLSVSPMLTERYLSAATKISRVAVGSAAIRPSTETFTVGKYLRQDDRVSEDLPFGSRGGTAIPYYFPVDGEYALTIFLDRTYDGRVRGLGSEHRLEVRLDGRKVQELRIGTDADGAENVRVDRNPSDDGAEIRFAAKAGPAVLGVSFVKKASEPEGMRRPLYAVTSYDYAGDIGMPPGVGSVELRGPYNVTGPGDSPSRSRIFVCHPQAREDEAAQLACARRITRQLARRAYRRPVKDDDAEPLLAAFKGAARTSGFDAGIEAAVRRVLVSPDFLFRIEQRPARGSAPVRVGDLELASRLSFFLWSSIPDEPLLRLAEQSRLHTPAVLKQETLRLLADPRARALTDNFIGQWLYLRNVRLHAPDPIAFPDFDDNVRQSLEREMSLFVQSQIRDDQPIPDLLTAKYTYLNERLARHYGVPGVYGSHFRRVEVADEARHGLLGKGAILMVTSYANRTSPVLRGKWLLDNVLGTPPSPPPPDVPALKDNLDGAPPTSVRERMEQHRASPACASCHRVMDPLGFALENFDGVGRWRSEEAGGHIDASGTLADGVTRVDGPVTLRTALLARPENFVTTVTEKLLTYALGRGTELYDGPVVRSIVTAARRDDYHWSSIVLGIVNSVPFQMSGAEDEP